MMKLLRFGVAALAALALATTASASASLSNGPPAGTLTGTATSPNGNCNYCREEIQEEVANPNPPPATIWVTRSYVRRRNVTVDANGKKVPGTSVWTDEPSFKPTPPTTGWKFRLVANWYYWNDLNGDGIVDEATEVSYQSTDTSTTVTM